jgi:hypothetical protein
MDLLPEDTMHEWDMFWLGREQYEEAFLGLGLFHGTVFGLQDWEFRDPVVAFVLVAAEEEGRERVIWDVLSDELILALPLTSKADIDLWEEVEDLFWCFAPGFPSGFCRPVGPLMLDTTESCGQGVYPDCTYWPGTSAVFRQDLESFSVFLDSVLGRVSWSSPSTMSCDDPDPDLFWCCETPQGGPHDIHAINVAGPMVSSFSGAQFVFATCHGVFTQGSSCPSAIGHEFGHGIDRAEKGVAYDEYLNDRWSLHSGAMGEGLADVVALGFKQLFYPGQGSQWGLNDERAYCSGMIRDLANPTSSQAEHASRLQVDQYSSHDNSLVVGHAFHLLGRSPTEGAKQHYGKSVTGIGIQKALLIFFRAMTTELTGGTERSLSDLRTALLLAAGHLYGYSSTEYNATRNVVDAMGYWTTPSALPQRFGARPEFGLFGSWSSQTLRYPTIVFKDGSTLKYRYRYLSGFSYMWTSPITIASSTGSFHVVTNLRLSGGVPVGYDVHVFYQDSNSYLRHWVRRHNGATYNWPVVWDSSGNPPVRLHASSQFRVVLHDGTYRIFYSPYTYPTVFLSNLNIDSHMVGGLYIVAGVSSSTRFEVGSDGSSLHIFPWPGPGNSIGQRKLVGSAFETVSPADSRIGSHVVNGEFDVASYLGSIHVVMQNATKDSVAQGLLYARCDGGCDTLGVWSRVGPVGTVFPDIQALDFVSLGEGFLPDGGVTLARQPVSLSLAAEYQTKYSK